jgi:hypothetical protein
LSSGVISLGARVVDEVEVDGGLGDMATARGRQTGEEADRRRGGQRDGRQRYAEARMGGHDDDDDDSISRCIRVSEEPCWRECRVRVCMLESM